MSLSYRGGIISSTGAVSNGGNIGDTAPGVWKLSDIGYLTYTNSWPGTALRDPDFNDVSVLLSGNNTNGSQNNTFLDSSSNNFAITRNGNTTQGSFSPYQNHWSNYFNGSSSIYTSTSQIIPATGDFTIEAWVALSWYDNPVNIFSQGTPGSSDYINVFVGGYGDNVAIEITIGTTIYYPTGPVIVGNWNHIAIQRTGSSVTGYLNGYAYLTATNSASIANAPLYIGSTSTPGNYFIGYVSNARVSNVVRYSAPFTPPAAPFVSDANTVLLTCQANRFLDSGPNAYTINRNGSPAVSRYSGTQLPQQYNTGNYGGSAYFDGTGDFLQVANNAAYSLDGDFTIQGWFNGSDYSSTIVFFQMGDSTSIIEMWVSAAGSVLRALVGSTTISSSSAMIPNQWTHFALVRSGTGSNNISLYANGVRQAQMSSNDTFSGTTNNGIRIGAEYPTGTPWNGYLSDIQIIKGTASYSGTTYTIPTAPFTNVSGTQFLASFTNAGIIDSTTISDFETIGNAQVSTSVKKFGTGSLAFDGSGDRLFVANSSPIFSLRNPGYTIEMWVYPTSYSGSPYLISSGASGGTFWAMYLTTGGALAWGGNTGANQFSAGSVPLNQWTHVAISQSNPNQSVYWFVNGSLVLTKSPADINYSNWVTTSQLSVGSNFGSNDFNGYIDDLRITRGVARYLQNFAVPVAPFPTY
jgi:hypothetical protein